MKRPMLVSGAATVIATALFLLLGQKTAVCGAAFGVSVILFSVILKKRLKKFYTFLFFGLCFILVCTSCTVFFNIYEAPAESFSKKSHDVTAYVCELPKSITSELSEYTFKIRRSDGENVSFKFTVTADNGLYELYDTVSFKNASFSYFDGDLSEKAYTEKIFLSLEESAAADFLFKKSPTPYYYCLKFKDGCISNMRKYLSGDSAALLSGMAFGEKSDLSDSLRSAFKACGVSHILAVSGLHVSLWCGILAAFLGLIGLESKAKSVISGLFLIFLCTVSAFTPSVVRASLMSGLTFFAPFFKRRPDSVNSLGFAVTVILILNPYIILNPSFVLSALATAGVIFSTFASNILPRPKLKGKFKNKLYDFFVSGTLVSICSTVFTLPACAYFFKSFSLLSPLANLFIVQPSFYAMASGVFEAFISFLPLPISFLKVIFYIPEYILKFISLAVRFISKIPYACVPAGPLTVVAILLFVGLAVGIYFLFPQKTKLHRVIKCFLCVLCAVSVFASSFIYLLPIRLNDELTVVSSSGYPVAVVRSGDEYALFGVPKGSAALRETKSALPATKNQALTYFTVMYKDVYSKGFTDILHGFFPENTLAVSSALSNTTVQCEKIGANKPTHLNKFRINEKIYAEIVDTNGECYVIISSGKARSAVSFSKYNNQAYAEKRCNTVVICESEASEFNSFCNELIVCTYKGMLSKDKERLKNYCNKLTVLREGESKTVTIGVEGVVF